MQCSDLKPLLKHFFYWSIVWATLITIAASLLIFSTLMWNGFIFHNISANHAVLDIILTTLLISTAGYQLYNLSKTSQNDFLLRLDDRFGSHEIITARAIIHKYYCKTYIEGLPYEDHIKILSDIIVNISFNENNYHEFTYLLHFLETMAYFCNTESIKDKDLKNLSGDSIKYYFKLFKPWIEKRRQLYGKNFYDQLEKLVNKI